MSGYVDWIGAQADELPCTPAPVKLDADKKSFGKFSRANAGQSLPAHNFPAQLNPKAPTGDALGEAGERAWDSDPDIWLYRKKTWALLRRYMQWSLEAGRLPSLLGRELFRAKITAYTATTFESRVIFLHDMERCLDRLQDFDRQLIARVCLQEYDHDAAARMLHCTRKTIERRLPDLIDELSDAFLKADLLDRLPETNEEEAL
jgi:hypothetical protein